MNPTLEGLARYVMQELHRGVPEAALYASLRQSGWTGDWINAALSAAKQQVMHPANQLTMPAVQPHLEPQQPARMAIPRQLPKAPEVQRKPRRQPKKQKPANLAGLKRTLIVVVLLLAAATTGLGIYRGIQTLNHAAEQRILRDAHRREDLSVFLSDLSDYYVAHKSYPTSEQLGDATFRTRNGFDADSITDPKWSKDNDCSAKGLPVLSEAATPGCYGYTSRPESGRLCDNEGTSCTKVTVTIPLETGEKSYSVTLHKNTQAN